jgi:hypothetical protein
MWLDGWGRGTVFVEVGIASVLAKKRKLPVLATRS